MYHHIYYLSVYMLSIIYTYILGHCSHDSVSQTNLRFNFNQEQNNMREERESKNGVSQESVSKA